MVKIEKLILKTKATDNLPLAPIEKAPQSYPRKSVNSKTRKIELNSFTKQGRECLKDNLRQLQFFFFFFFWVVFYDCQWDSFRFFGLINVVMPMAICKVF